MTNSLAFAKELVAKSPTEEELMDIPQAIIGANVMQSIMSVLSYMKSEGLSPDTLICSEDFGFPRTDVIKQLGILSFDEYTDYIVSSLNLSRINMKTQFLWIVDSTVKREEASFSIFVIRRSK
jgi:hypothetical protein